jgi:hypothetical protein
MLLSYFQETNKNKNHPNRTQQDSILTSNTVEGEIGDQWRANIIVDKNWDSWDKLGIKSNYFKIITRPSWAFFKSYFLRLGILDGKNGYRICKQSFNVTLLKYQKLYKLWHQNN